MIVATGPAARGFAVPVVKTAVEELPAAAAKVFAEPLAPVVAAAGAVVLVWEWLVVAVAAVVDGVAVAPVPL
ncbi:hypothetical protein BDW74DRAFT_142115 [Aspergillus multicolor]|uniref:uncharacterized protein n=1 Tax=Aspergillus multicolor TaxID=41759 RepID=UPI003CCD01FA